MIGRVPMKWHSNLQIVLGLSGKQRDSFFAQETELGAELHAI